MGAGEVIVVKWLFGVAANAAAGKLLAQTKGKRIWKAIELWAQEDLPQGHLQTPVSLFPEELSDDLESRPILTSVHRGFAHDECPSEKVWVSLLNEQKEWVLQTLKDGSAEFFHLPDDVTTPLFKKLAKRIVQALAQDDAVAKEFIRDTNAKLDILLEKLSPVIDSNSPSANNVESFTHSASNEGWHESEFVGSQAKVSLGEQITPPEGSLIELKTHAAKQQDKIIENAGLLAAARIESIAQLLLEKEIRTATEKAVEFQEWLATRIEDLSRETLVRCYVTLGRVAIVNQSALGVGNDLLETCSGILEACKGQPPK